jgi:membrane protein YfhO
MSKNTIIRNGIPHFIACLIFLAISAFYFSSQLEGKVEKAGDIISARANLQEIIKYEKETGTRTQWTNSLFSGMPAYQIDGSQPGNMTKYVEKISRLFIARPIGMFFSAMIVFYIMLVLLGVNPWLSIVGAIAFGLTTNNYVLYSAGHMSKIYAIIHLGLVTAGVLLAFRKKYLLGGLVFAIGLALDLYSNHIQMTYYFLLTLGIYGLIELVKHILDKDMASYGKAVLYLGIGGILALGAGSGKLLTSYEYGQDTMRGDPILEADATTQKTSSHTSGLDYEYATKWSNGWMDLVAGFIPGVVGGGGVTYWGANVDGTSGPAYYGAIVFFLFIFGLLVVKGPVKWWLLSGILFISFISMGNHFFLHGLLFDWVPMFNKFRTPNSALSVVTFMIPILGFLALNDVIKGNVSKKELLQSLYISGGFMAAVCLFYALLGSSVFDFSYVNDTAYAQNYNINITALKSQRADMMSSDSWRSLGLILVAAALIWAFIHSKINKIILIMGLGVLIAGDLWTINKDYLNSKNFVTPNTLKTDSQPRPVDTKILADKDPHYRVFDLSGGLSAAVNSSPISNITSYYHKNVGGYHPAKLQRYQDMLDRHILPEAQQLGGILQNAKSMADIEGPLRNLPAFNMLNTKYFIVNNESPIPNQYALGNAWFVDSYKVVNSANEEIDGLRGINPAQQALVHKEFSDYVSGLNIQKNGTIKLTDYKPDYLTYASNTSSDQLAVFSEVWYGPDKGWNAYVDGTKVNHIRVDYVLRALKIPAGEHVIEFKFEPRSYAIGSTLSLICSLLIILGLLGFIGYRIKQKMDEPDEVKMKTDSKKATKPTASKRKKK